VRPPARAAAARGEPPVHELHLHSRYLIIDNATHAGLQWRLARPRGISPTRLCSSTGQTPQVHFGGLPRFAKTNPRASAAHRSRLANLSASLRSGPGGIRRASSKASTARVPQSYLPVERRVSLSITPQSSCQLDPFGTFDSKTPIWIMFIPGSDLQYSARYYSQPSRRPSKPLSLFQSKSQSKLSAGAVRSSPSGRENG